MGCGPSKPQPQPQPQPQPNVWTIGVPIQNADFFLTEEVRVCPKKILLTIKLSVF